MSNYNHINNPFNDEALDQDLISPVGYPTSPENRAAANAGAAGTTTLFTNDTLVQPLGSNADSTTGFEAFSNAGHASSSQYKSKARDISSAQGNISVPRAEMPGIGPSEGFLDTLDEPVWQTISRDLTAIWTKLKQVMLPYGNRTVLKDWDLWGPLLLCLALAIRQSVTASSQQASLAFTGVFVVVWGGSALLTVNAKVLGGSISFFQSVCVCGYCIFPLIVASIVTLFVPWIVIRAPIVGVAYAWSVYASSGFLTDTHLENRRALAVYPVFLFYFVIAWMILISHSVLG